MIDLKTQRDAATKAAQDVADSTVEFAAKAKDLGVSSAKSATESASGYMDKAMEFGTSAADSATDAFKTAFEKAQSLTGTVDTVEEKIDVDQIQDQVAKLREQMEQVLVSWKDTFSDEEGLSQEGGGEEAGEGKGFDRKEGTRHQGNSQEVARSPFIERGGTLLGPASLFVSRQSSVH